MKFKHTYDALVAQYEQVQQAAERIEARFAENDFDGALALEAELNEAQAKADQIGALYQKLTSTADNDANRYFVPASDLPKDEGEQKTLSRAAFDRLQPAEKAEFVAAGGVIQDEEA